MKVHPDELELARAYGETHAFEELSPSQLHAVMDRGRSLHHRFKAHPYRHNLINGGLILCLFACEAGALVTLPSLILRNDRGLGTGWILLAALIAGAAHSWITPQQRRQFLLEPFTEFPRFLYDVVPEANEFPRNRTELQAGSGQML